MGEEVLGNVSASKKKEVDNFSCVKEEEEETWEEVRTTETAEWTSKAGLSKEARRGELTKGLWAAESLPQWLLPWGSSSAPVYPSDTSFSQLFHIPGLQRRIREATIRPGMWCQNS